MTVLVAYASRHGATQGIAERVADRLRAAGLAVECRRVSEVRDVAGFDAFVVGAAAYLFHWLGDATRFARRHRSALASHPTWLFSSGPLGTDLVDAQVRDVFEVCVPREFAELKAAIRPRDTRVFFGAWDRSAPPKALSERFMRLMPANDAMPAGDFRDWPAIEAWADGIAAELLRATVSAGS